MIVSPLVAWHEVNDMWHELKDIVTHTLSRSTSYARYGTSCFSWIASILACLRICHYYFIVTAPYEVQPGPPVPRHAALEAPVTRGIGMNL